MEWKASKLISNMRCSKTSRETNSEIANFGGLGSPIFAGTREKTTFLQDSCCQTSSFLKKRIR
jgi:hypothetical protein